MRGTINCLKNNIKVKFQKTRTKIGQLQKIYQRNCHTVNRKWAVAYR